MLYYVEFGHVIKLQLKVNGKYFETSLTLHRKKKLTFSHSNFLRYILRFTDSEL
jgi:hypothetical protein